MILGLDCDGILVDFTTAYHRLLVEVDGRDLLPKDFKLPPVWNWETHYGYSKPVVDEVWKRIKGSRTFWQALQPLPGAAEFVEGLQETSHELYFITDRPGIETQAQTTRWLHMLTGNPAAVIISRRGKGPVCAALSIDLYIDDKPENVEDVWEKSPRTRVMMLKYPYNSRLHGIDGAIDSLKEFEDEIKRLEENR